MEVRGEMVTWTSFQESFLRKHFPVITKNKKEYEFLSKYITYFEYLLRFYNNRSLRIGSAISSRKAYDMS
ncbi:hypothetical protein CR513_38340, partial [Mucuna pruriens]